MDRPAHPFNLGLFLEKEKLKSSGSNFNDCSRNLRILLVGHNKTYVLEKELVDPPSMGATNEAKAAYDMHYNDDIVVRCGMLQSMEADIQKRIESHAAYEMLEELKTMF